jgi:hypothetical protein
MRSRASTTTSKIESVPFLDCHTTTNVKEEDNEEIAHELKN